MTLERELICATWRMRLSAALDDYRKARDFRQGIQDELPHLPYSDGGHAFRQALIAESQAQIEYSRTLAIFTDVAVHGRRPNE